MSTLEQAVTYIERGQVEEGLHILQHRVKEGSDEEKYDVAHYYYKLGFLDEALDIVQDLHVLYPEESELTLFLAEIYIDLDKEDEAIEALNTIAEDDELYVRALLLLADLYQMRGFDEVAEQKLLEARQMLPDEPIIIFGLGELYSSQGNYAEAVSYYSRLQEHKQIGGVAISLRLAECLSALGEWQEAVGYYEAGLGEHEDAHALYGYAFTLYQAGMYERAAASFSKLRELDPEYSSLYVYLASSYDKQGMFKESYEVLQEARKVDEFSADLHMRFAEAAAKVGNIDEAEQSLKEALALEPTHMQAVSELIHLYKKQENYEGIVEIINMAQEYGEHDPQLLRYLAGAKKELEQYSDALKYYREAYTSFKDDPSFLEEYGYFLLEEGLHEEAKRAFALLLQLDPTQTEIEQLLRNLEDSY